MSGVFSIRQAAYLMGMRVETVKRMIDGGKLLTIKALAKNADDDDPIIHETEMSRFQHPWEHIFRLDERANAQQTLVETLKTKINESLGENYRSDVEEMRLDLEQMRAEYQNILMAYQRVKPMLDKLPAVYEDVQGIRNSLNSLEPSILEKMKGYIRRRKK
jgi:hypothetical protein